MSLGINCIIKKLEIHLWYASAVINLVFLICNKRERIKRESRSSRENKNLFKSHGVESVFNKRIKGITF